MACARPPVVTEMPEIRLPGGPILKALPQSSEPDDGAVTRALLGQAMTALAPLLPVFKVIDAILALKDFAAAVPEAVTNFDPSGLFSSLQRVASAADALAQLVPALSIPILARDLVAVLARYLGTIETDLASIQEQIQNAARAATEAAQLEADAPAGATALRETESCVLQQAQDRLQAVTAAAGPVASVLQLLGLLTQLAGMPSPPSLDLAGGDVDAVLEAVAGARSALEAFLSLIGG